jgi:transmembrane sensor
MTAPGKSDTLDDVEAAAAAWDARLRSAGATERERLDFQTWLAADAAHQAAYDRLQGLLAILRLHVEETPELSALRDEARIGARRRASRRGALVGLGVAASLLAAVGLGLQTPFGADLAVQLTGGQVYRSGVGERTKVTLADGSILTLDSRTRLITRMRAARRDVTLQSGRALFQVAKDPNRPFVVRAGDRTVTALGTTFDVRLDEGRMRVTLVEGKVAVRDVAAASGASPTILAPRQQLAEAPDRAARVRTVDTTRTLAWTEGHVFFEDEPLVDAVAEMNRYAKEPIVVADPRIAGLRINGMFRTANTIGFIGALQITLPVEARTDDRGRILIFARPEGAPGGS